MPKVVTFTDSHIRMSAPVGRIEKNWLDVCLGQFEQVLAIAKREEADAVLCSGDLGDSPKWAPEALVRFMDLVSQYGIPIITTLGQHDVYGHNIDTWTYTGVGVLAAADAMAKTGLFTVLRNGDYELIGDDIAVYGFAFEEDTTKDLLSGRWQSPKEHKPRVRIGLVHASVGAEAGYGWEGIADQCVRGLHIAQFGDIHEGFDIFERENEAQSFSPGSLVRSSRNDIGRTPLCAIIDVTAEGWTIAYEDVPDGDDEHVFITDAVLPDMGDMAQDFKNMLARARDYKDEHPRDRVERIGKSGGYTKKQQTLVLERLEETA